MRTVLIDDDATGVFLMTRLFHQEGLDEGLSTFLSPEEAVAALEQQAQTGTLPQVILLDLNMPRMSGWDVLEALQPIEPSLSGRCAIFIVTSSLAPADAARAREHPLVAGLLHKPLSRADIQALRAQLPDGWR